MLGRSIQRYMRYRREWNRMEENGAVRRREDGGGREDLVKWAEGCGYYDKDGARGEGDTYLGLGPGVIGMYQHVPSRVNNNSGPGAQRDSKRRGGAKDSEEGRRESKGIKEEGWKGGGGEFWSVMREGKNARQR